MQKKMKTIYYQVAAKAKGDVAEDVFLATAAAAEHTYSLESAQLRMLLSLLGKSRSRLTLQQQQLPDFRLFHSTHHRR